MLKIRFFRTGRKNQPFYRIVVTDSRNAPQGGRFLEKVGFLNPFTKEQKLNEERIKYWLSSGAQPTDRVHNMLVEAKIIPGSKVDVLKKKITESTEESSNEVAPVPVKDEPKKEDKKVSQEIKTDSEKGSPANPEEISSNGDDQEKESQEKDKKE